MMTTKQTSRADANAAGGRKFWELICHDNKTTFSTIKGTRLQQTPLGIIKGTPTSQGVGVGVGRP